MLDDLAASDTKKVNLCPVEGLPVRGHAEEFPSTRCRDVIAKDDEVALRHDIIHTYIHVGECLPRRQDELSKTSLRSGNPWDWNVVVDVTIGEDLVEARHVALAEDVVGEA